MLLHSSVSFISFKRFSVDRKQYVPINFRTSYISDSCHFKSDGMIQCQEEADFISIVSAFGPSLVFFM